MTGTSRPFIPPFCPRPIAASTWTRPAGSGSTSAPTPASVAPRLIPRFRCRHCRSTFSSQTFSTTYYLKRPELQAPVFHRLIACSGYRQIAREARCAPSTVMGQAARLGRHALLFLHQHRPRAPVQEPLVIDGFESFAYSQYHPLHLNLAVGAESHYAYAVTHTELRRKGRMTAAQQRRREALERTLRPPQPGALDLGMSSSWCGSPHPARSRW